MLRTDPDVTAKQTLEASDRPHMLERNYHYTTQVRDPKSRRQTQGALGQAESRMRGPGSGRSGVGWCCGAQAEGGWDGWSGPDPGGRHLSLGVRLQQTQGGGPVSLHGGHSDWGDRPGKSI